MNFKISALSAAALLMVTGIVQAGPVNITTLPGYEVVTSGTFNFNAAGGWAGWSITGKEVLGAKIISSGDSISDFSAFRPVGPGETTPFGYTYGANEYGFILQSVFGVANSSVQIELYYADPLAGYTITKSGQLNYAGTGLGGWSAPLDQVVSGGGYQFSTSGASPFLSQVVLENGNVAGYQYGPNEQGWEVQSAQVGGPANLYVISFDAPASVPEPATLALIGLGLAGISMSRRRKAS